MEKLTSAYSEPSILPTTSSEKSRLCDVCQAFNIAELLAQAGAQTSIKALTRLDGLHDEEMEFKSGLPLSYEHHKSLGALEAAAEFGCSLCSLIWKCWSESRARSPEVDKSIDDAGQGQVFIGTSGYSVSKAEMPLVTVTQRPDGRSSRTLCTLDAFTERDSVVRKTSHAIGTPVATHSDSDACRAAATEWFEECRINHPQCGPSKAFRRPTRLINVGENSSEPPCLEIEQPPESTTWVALSYCWGGDADFILKRDTFQNLKDGIPLEDWPATHRDAIKITRSLSIQYIWIDALCIMQDDADDWRAEAARMQDVYSGAAVTIIASESPKTSAGIHAARPPIEYAPCEIAFRKNADDKDTIWLRKSIPNAINASYSDPVQTRGWTLQEGLLAPRTLSFHKDQMVWECSNYRIKESGHITKLDHMFDSKDLFHNKIRHSKVGSATQKVQFGWLKQISVIEAHKSRLGWLPKYIMGSGENMKDSLGINPYTRWFEIIFEYTRRDFTKYSDTLPALGGIARAFATITKDRYCAGMWESELLQCLCWFREARKLEKKGFYDPDNMDLEKPTEYRAPSWSWASINGGRVKMYNSAIDGTTPLINIATPVKIHLEPVADDPYGQLKSGYLSIKGSLFQLGDLTTKYWRNVSSSWAEYRSLSKNNDIDLDKCANPALHAFVMQQLNKGSNETFEYEQQHISHPNQKFAAFVLAITEGLQDNDIGNPSASFTGNAQLLLLETTGGAKDEYRRIGKIVVERPSELYLIAPEVERLETRKWKKIEEEQWKRFDGEFRTTTSLFDEVAARAWIEIAKDKPERVTVRII